MRFLKSKVQILAFGELRDDSIIFGSDASDLTETLRQVEEALRSYNNAVENTIRVSTQLTKQGIQVRASLDQIGQSGTRVTSVIEGLVTSQTTLKESLNLTSQSLVVAQKDEQRLTEARERAKRVSIELAEADIKRAQAARLAAKATTVQIVRRLAPTAATRRFGPSVQETRALGDALGRLQEIQQRFNISQEKVIRIFTRVKAGGIDAYSGVNRQIANASLSILKANQAMGQSAQRLAKVGASAQKAGKLNVQAARKSEIGWRSFGRLIFVNVVSRAFGALTQVIRTSIEQAAEFSIKIGEIRTIQGDNVRATSQWVGELRELSEAFGIPILDAAEAAYQTLSNQIAKGVEVSIFLADAQKLSIAGVSTLTESTNLLSSAINAFGLRTSDAKEISDSFFKTIELGRLRIGDIANSFGRVAVIANQLGVNLNETNAAIATLTIQGIRSDEALTLLRNIMLKLIRPTDEMKKKFEEFGVTSGESLIQTFGFAGAIQKFAEIAEREGTPAIGELFGRVRAITGILGLARDEGIKFANTLGQINNAAGATDQAVAKITETIGFRFRREVEAIRNFITIDLGEKLLKNLLAVTDAFGGLANVVKAFTVALGILAGAFILQKALLVGLAITYAIYDAAIISATFATAAFTATLLANPFTFVVAGIVLATAAIAGLILAFTRAAKRVEESIKVIRDELAELAKDEKRFADEINKELRESLDFRFKERQQEIARERAALNEQLQFELNVLKEIDKELKRTFRDATKALKDSIRKSEQEAKRALREIERSAKRVREAIQQDLVEQFSRSLENLLPVDKINELDDRITDLIVKAGALFEEVGNDAGVTFDDVLAQLKEAADRIKEIDKIRKDAERDITRLTDRRGTILQKNSDAEIKFLRRRSDLEAAFQRARGDPEKQAKIIERIRRLEEDANQRIRRRREEFAKIEQQLQAQQALLAIINALGRRDVELAERRKVLEEARQVRLENEAAIAKETAARERQQLRAFEESFRELQAFDPVKIIGKGTPEEIEEAKRRLDEAAVSARKILKTVEDAGERRRLIESIETKRLAALNAIRILEEKKVLDAVTKNLEVRRKLTAEVFAEAEEKQKDFTKTINEETKKALDILQETFGKGGPLVGILAGPLEDVEESVRLALVGTRKDLDAFIASIDEIRKKVRRPFGTGAPIAGLVPEEVLQAFLSIARSVAEVSKARQEFSTLTEQLEKISTNLGTLEKPTEDFAVRLERAQKAAEGLAKALESQVGSRARLATLTAFGFSHGGLVPGRGRSDTVPALLSPGEFVVNANATRKFFTQLQSINSGSIQRFQEGGIVNNIGDINVSIQDAPTNVDGRTIARAIKRELFRGSVRLR